MVVAGVLSSVGSISTVVAALAALMTIVLARKTVAEARAGRSEARGAHLAEMDQQAVFLEATTTAHEREMQARANALASELVLQRLAQVGRVEELIGEVSDIARFEIEHPPLPIEGQIGTWTRITCALARLEAAIVICERLGVAGGVADVLAEARKMSIEYRRVRTPPESVVGATMGMLDRMK